MKSFLVKYRLHQMSATQQTVVTANNFADAKKIVQSQFGSALHSIVSVNEQ